MASPFQYKDEPWVDTADRSINPKAIEGRKKLQSQFTPIAVLNEMHDGMAEGARKYGAYNWRENKIEVSDYYDSTMRHVNSWWGGEDIDPDSGVHHISKAITGLLVLRDAILEDFIIDDRPRSINRQCPE